MAERVPSATAGTRRVLAATNRFTPRLQVSTSSNLPIRVLTTSPLRYAVLTKEASTWGACWRTSQASAQRRRCPTKVSTSLSDELVRNFTDVSTADNETYTVAFGAKAGRCILVAASRRRSSQRRRSPRFQRVPCVSGFVGVPSLINSFLWLRHDAAGPRLSRSAAPPMVQPMLAFGPLRPGQGLNYRCARLPC